MFSWFFVLLQKQKQYLYDLSQLKDHYEDRCSGAKRLRELHETQNCRKRERERSKQGCLQGYLVRILTMKCGAENNTASVAIMVKSVKIIRHKRSTTIAANFQSRVMSPVSSSFLSCVRHHNQFNVVVRLTPTHLIGYPAQLLQYQRQFVFCRRAQTGVGNGFVHASITNGGNGSNGTHRTHTAIIALPVGRAQ